MYQIFLSGGWLMWPLLICSIIVVAISIERFITLKADRIIPSGMLARVWQQLRNKELQGEQLKRSPRFIAPGLYLWLPASVIPVTGGIL